MGFGVDYGKEGRVRKVPGSAVAPALSADEAAFAVPVCCEAAPAAVVAANVAVTFRPVLEVVALAGVEVGVRIGPGARGGDGSRSQETGGEKGELDHGVFWRLTCVLRLTKSGTRANGIDGCRFWTPYNR
jgi:hypothetical protein